MTGKHASEGCTAWEADALSVVDWLQKPVEEYEQLLETIMRSIHRKGTANHE